MLTYVKQGLVSLSVLAAVTAAEAGPMELYMQRYLDQKQPALATGDIKTKTFRQLIDHNNPGLGYFSQRYYIDEQFGRSNESPVFFYICGEGACSDSVLNGAIRTYAQQHKAKLVALEHRYYGKSLPMPSFSTQDLVHLNTDAALDDLAYFQRRLKNEKNWTGQWIAFGGSYPGALSAWYRLKYPYLVAGSLASSAPVQARDNFIEYDAHVTRHLPATCVAQVREVTHQVEAALDNPAHMKKIKAQFDASEVQDNVDFLYLLADGAAVAVQYGMSAHFCQTLASASDPMTGYARYAKELYRMFGVNAVQMTAQGALSERPSDYSGQIGVRQWYYQSCKEFGYWQNAHPDSALSTRSQLITMAYHQNVCQRLFGLSEPVDVSRINNQYYYPLMSDLVSNILFTNGEQDPWSNLSLSEKNDNAENPHLSYETIAGGSHCSDLRSPTGNDSESLKQARQRTNRLLTEWLQG